MRIVKIKSIESDPIDYPKVGPKIMKAVGKAGIVATIYATYENFAAYSKANSNGNQHCGCGSQ